MPSRSHWYSDHPSHCTCAKCYGVITVDRSTNNLLVRYLFSFPALVAGLWIGDWFPDIDQNTGLLLHRSFVTHGPLIPFLVAGFAFGTRTFQFRWFALGLSVGFALHLCFDLFPNGWSGFALISVLGFGWTPQWFSMIWIATSIISCTYIAIRLVRSGLDSLVFTVTLIGGFGYMTIEEGMVWKPLMAIAIACLISLALVARRVLSDDE